jgi:biopolymer transport protein ExbD
MRLASKPARKPPAENMIPLINIVFLILIFFLVASIVRPFSDRQVRLAESSETKGPGAAARMVVLRRDGDIYIGREQVGPAELQQRFAVWAADDPTRGVTLVADRGMEAATLIEIVTQANAAGMQDVKLLTRKAR